VTRILLVGLMGTGKTTIGRVLADELGWVYLDNDELVRRARGSALEELRARSGGEDLHEAESAALYEALAAPAPLIAGIAAWAVVPPENRQAMRGGDAYVAWLRARPETLVERIGTDTRRPWLQPDPLAALTRMATERAGYFAEVSDVTVDVDAGDARAAAAQILAGLGRTPRLPPEDLSSPRPTSA
jgi:shikimate kinase